VSRLFWSLRRMCKHNIKMCHRQADCVGMRWMEQAQGHVQWRVFALSVLNLPVLLIIYLQMCMTYTMKLFICRVLCTAYNVRLIATFRCPQLQCNPPLVVLFHDIYILSYRYSSTPASPLKNDKILVLFSHLHQMMELGVSYSLKITRDFNNFRTAHHWMVKSF
jgi:hypothetical protein